MKQYLFLLLAIACATGAKAQDYIKVDSARYYATMAYKAFKESQDPDIAISYYLRSFEEGNTNVDDMFFCAKIYAFIRNYEELIPMMIRCAEAGFNEPKQLDNYIFFEPIRKEAWYEEVYNKIKDNHLKNEREYSGIREKLLQIWKEKQRVIDAWIQLEFDTPEGAKAFAIVQVTDSAHYFIIESILKRYGWLSPLQIGDDAFEVLCHFMTVADAKFMEAYYPMLLAAVNRDEFKASELAVLVDKIRVSKGLPQLYGTHTYWERKKHRRKFDEILDAEHVNEHRASVGLEPLAEYGKNFGIE